MPGNTPYCLAKGGMRMLTRTAGLELARYNILVVGVGPGAVATPINLVTMNDRVPSAVSIVSSKVPGRPDASSLRQLARGVHRFVAVSAYIKDLWVQAGLDIRLEMGMEIFLTPDTPAELKSGKVWAPRRSYGTTSHTSRRRAAIGASGDE